MLKYLNSLRSSCSQRSIPLISQATQDFLSTIIGEKKPKLVLEIGSAVGYSTIFISSLLKQRNGCIYSFERSYPSYLEGLHNIKSQQTNNIVLYPFNFLNINLQDLLPYKPEFVFMDAQKSEYGNYIQKIEGVLSQQATIIIDDVIKYKSKLSGLYDYLEKKQINYQIIQLEQDDGVMIIGN